MLKDKIKALPVVGPAALRVYHRFRPPPPFRDSRSYWVERYASGENSGPGSYNRLAAFKAEVLNAFVAEQGVRSVIEFGCGDGNQLKLARYPSYVGFDVSPQAIALCRAAFGDDDTKAFRLVDAYDGDSAELALSLDVIFHLIEDDVFDAYMRRLFDAAERFVIIYSSDTDDNPADRRPHVRHRHFSRWVAAHQPDWRLVEVIPNRYPDTGDKWTSSFSDFHIYARAAEAHEAG